MEKANIFFTLNSPVQEHFHGLGAVYHGYAGQPDDVGRVYNEAQCELEAKRAAEIGIKIARTYYGWYAWENGCWNWESDKMKSFCQWVSKMKKYGIQIALQAGWCFPEDVWGKGWNGETPYRVEGDWKKSVMNYSQWISASVRYLVLEKGFDNIKYLVMFTEPQRACKNQFGGETGYRMWLDCVKAVHEELTADGTRNLVKLMGPNEGATATSDMLKWAVNNASDYIDVFSSHNYDFIPDITTTNAHSKKGTFATTVCGGRCYQRVKLKPNTEYHASAYVKIVSDNLTNIGGFLMVGAFSGNYDDIESGRENVTRLNQHSVLMIDPSGLSDQWEKVEFTFHSGDANECLFGFWNEILSCVTYVFIEGVVLAELSTKHNLIVNGNFESDDGWKYCGGGNASRNPYNMWYHSTKVATEVIAHNKEMFVDEFNTTYDDIFKDPTHGTRIAIAECAFLNAGANCTMIWTLFDQIWPNNHANGQRLSDSFYDGDHRWGVMPNLLRVESKNPYPSYYLLQLLCKSCGEDGTIYSGGINNNVCSTLIMHKSGQVTVLIVNSEYLSKEIDIGFSRPVNAQLYRYSYNPNQAEEYKNYKSIESDETIFVKDLLDVKLQPLEVVVYTSLASL